GSISRCIELCGRHVPVKENYYDIHTPGGGQPKRFSRADQMQDDKPQAQTAAVQRDAFPDAAQYIHILEKGLLGTLGQIPCIYLTCPSITQIFSIHKLDILSYQM